MGLISSLGGNLGPVAGAANVLMSIFTSPMIGGLYKDKSYTTAAGTMFMTILKNIGFPIFTDEYDVEGGNEISEQVLVTALNSDNVGAAGGTVGALTKIADNIVVNPRVWSIHGYMGVPDSMFQMFGSNNPVSAGIGAALRIIQDLGQDLFYAMLQSWIEGIADARQPFKFTTAEGETVPCFFKKWKFPKSAKNQNMIEVEFTIQEFRFIALDNGRQFTNNRKGFFENGINTAQVVGRCVAKAIF